MPNLKLKVGDYVQHTWEYSGMVTTSVVVQVDKSLVYLSNPCYEQKYTISRRKIIRVLDDIEVFKFKICNA